jgi:solute carrier family 35 protein F1/2
MATQVLSVITCGTAVFTQILKNWYRFDASISQMFLIYVILGIVFGTILAARDDFLTTIKNNWWKYIIVGAADVEANYLVVLSQKYTTLTSVQLLDSFSLFTVLVLSFLFLRVRYHLIHLIGIFICIVGMACLIVADLDKKQEGYNIPLGDVLCLCGSMLFGISNVTQEFLVKKHTIVEFLALLGISGTIISGIQLSVLERTSLVSVNWNNYRVALLLAGFIVALVLFYILMPVMLRRSSATVVDLSLLTADFYALLCGIVIFKYTVSLSCGCVQCCTTFKLLFVCELFLPLVLMVVLCSFLFDHRWLNYLQLKTYIKGKASLFMVYI